jgi:hypothetical protein
MRVLAPRAGLNAVDQLTKKNCHGSVGGAGERHDAGRARQREAIFQRHKGPDLCCAPPKQHQLSGSVGAILHGTKYLSKGSGFRAALGEEGVRARLTKPSQTSFQRRSKQRLSAR